MTPPWWMLLEHQHRVGRMGLTPSFLLGGILSPAGAHLSASEAIEAFSALLRSMRDDIPGDGRVRIMPCINAGQPIAMIPYSTRALGLAVRSEDNSESRLSGYPDYFASESRDLDSLVAGLWRVFGESILAGTYSVHRGSFRPFDEDDRRFVEDALTFEEV